MVEEDIESVSVVRDLRALVPAKEDAAEESPTDPADPEAQTAEEEREIAAQKEERIHIQTEVDQIDQEDQEGQRILEEAKTPEEVRIQEEAKTLETQEM